MVTPSAVKDVVPAAVNLDNGILQALIDRAQALVQRQTGGRWFGKREAFSDFLTGNGSRYMLLGDVVTGSITSVIERAYPGGDDTVISSGEYAVRPAGTSSTLVRLGGSKWTQGLEYEVIYQRGYPTNEGPKDIEQLIIDLVGLRLKMRGKDGMRSESIGGYSYTVFGEGDFDAIPGAWDTIKAWRRPVFA